jgi:hypothetical protein
MSQFVSLCSPTKHVCRYGCRQQRQPHLVGSASVGGKFGVLASSPIAVAFQMFSSSYQGEGVGLLILSFCD